MPNNRTFIIPSGDSRLKIEYYSNQMRKSWDLAGAAREKFKGYKRVLRRFHLKSTDTEAHRVLLSQVTSSHLVFKNFKNLKFYFRVLLN